MCRLCQILCLLWLRFLYSVIFSENSGPSTKDQLHEDCHLSSRCWLSPHHVPSFLSHNHRAIYPGEEQEVSTGPLWCSGQAFLKLLRWNWNQRIVYSFVNHLLLLLCQHLLAKRFKEKKTAVKIYCSIRIRYGITWKFVLSIQPIKQPPITV